MKKIISILIIVVSVFACAKEDYESAYQPYAGLNPGGLETEVLEDGGQVKIPVIFGGDLANSGAIKIGYEITGGTYGVDYTIDGASGPTGTVTVQAGKVGTGATDAVGFIVINSISDFDTEDDVPLTVTLKSIDNSSVRLGYPYKTSFDFAFVNDDCDYVYERFVGTAAATEIYTNGKYGPYAAGFIETSPNHITLDNFYDFGIEVELIYHPDTRVVEVVPNAFTNGDGDWDISGSGKINPCKTQITITYKLKDSYDGFDGTFNIIYQFPEPEDE